MKKALLIVTIYLALNFLWAAKFQEYDIYLAGEKIGYAKIIAEEKGGLIKFISSEQLEKPINLKVERMEIVYTAQFHPVSFFFEGLVNGTKQEIKIDYQKGKAKGYAKVKDRTFPIEQTVPEGILFQLPSGPVTPLAACAFAFKRMGVKEFKGNAYIVPQMVLPLLLKKREKRLIVAVIAGIEVKLETDLYGNLLRLNIPTQGLTMIKKGLQSMKEKSTAYYKIKGPNYFGREELLLRKKGELYVRKIIAGISEGKNRWKQEKDQLIFEYEGTIMGKSLKYRVVKKANGIILFKGDKSFKAKASPFINPDLSLFYLSEEINNLPESFRFFYHSPDFQNISLCRATLKRVDHEKLLLQICGFRGYFLFKKGSRIVKAVDPFSGEEISFKGFENFYPIKTPQYRYTGNFIEKDVSFPSGEVKLAGTLTLPSKGKKFPAVVFLTGSGPQDRNENSPGKYGLKLYFFARIAHRLAEAGIASLRFDDRGVGKSGGKRASVEELVKDAMAALDFLNSCSEINKEKLFLLGHSEGAMVAVKVATRKKLAGIILLACPCRSGADTILWQLEKGLKLGGFSENYINFALKKEKLILQSIMTGKTYPAVSDEVRRLEPIKDWFKEFLLLNPCEDLRNVRVPVLVLQGGKDAQVPPEDSGKIAKILMKQKVPVKVSFFPELNHLFLKAETGAVSEYGFLIYSGATPPEEVFESILNWIKWFK